MMRTRIGIAMLAAVASAACEKPPPGDVSRYARGDERIAPISDPLDGGFDEAGEPLPVRSWATGAWDDPWIPYPARTQLDVDHGLGRTPIGVLVYLSFTPDGDSPGLAAGDLAQLRVVDETHVVVWNNTNGSYYARIVVF